MSYNTYNNNQQQNSKTPELTVYSWYRMNNAESTVDATCLTFRYWKNNLCISINPKKVTNNGEISFDMDNGITIYLSHTKARILKNELTLFMKDPVNYNGVGVPSGQSAITISNGSEYGKNNPVLTIRKIGEGGVVLASFAYEFKRDYHYSIRNYDGKDFDSVYEDYQNIEIEQVITVLDEYIKAATNAIAFSVMEQRKYSATRVENTINSIAAALNVETKSANGSQKRYSSSSYFANSGSSESSSVSYGAATMDDLD